VDRQTSYARDGQVMLEGSTFPAFELSRKPDLINRAGGFVVEIDVTGIGGILSYNLPANNDCA